VVVEVVVDVVVVVEVVVGASVVVVVTSPHSIGKRHHCSQQMPPLSPHSSSWLTRMQWPLSQSKQSG
jgi:hypothetical protein